MPGEERTVLRPEPAARAQGLPVPSETEAEQASIEQPAKLLRIAVMVGELLEEVRRAPLDEETREHLRDIHAKVIAELKTGLSGELVEELERLSLPLPSDDVPTESEIRIAQAQLMEMRRRALPQGTPPDEDGSTQPGTPPGQYL